VLDYTNVCVIDGLLFYEGDSDAASLNPALNAAMLMTRYAPIASNGDKQVSYLVRPRFHTRTITYDPG
jgi:hypothetical protein